MPKPPKSRRKKKRGHVITWLREQLGETQAGFAHLVGVSRDTVQSIELDRLRLSERLAYRIAEETGVRAKWLLANNLGKSLPDREHVRQQFEEAQAGRWKLGFYQTALLPRLFFFNVYVLYRAVTFELGYSGFRRAGGEKLLREFSLKLLEMIPDKRVRKKIFHDSKEVVLDAEKRYALALGDLRELRRVKHEVDGRNR